ncbi:MAG: phosphotriesterase [Pedobacter sp.]|nr:MAG: phosphotriesterase [Pedobacter sp.]
MNRRKFISVSSIAGITCLYSQGLRGMGQNNATSKDYIVTVNGNISVANLGMTLAHEHIITDFAGAEKNINHIYSDSEAIKKILPYLIELKKSGVNSIIECTPAHIGRNVRLLKALSSASGLQIVTNTGYYAAVGQKYLPRHAFTESSDQIALRWLQEWKNGIEGTGIRPGFIKLGVDTGPLKEIEKKMIRAAAITHAGSGLKIFIHTGDAAAAREEAAILAKEGIGYEAMIWVHAQNDVTGDTHIELAKKGCWISLDGVNEQASSIDRYTAFITRMKDEGLLHKLLISHDDGFAVEKTGNVSVFNPYQNGNTHPYRSLFTHLKSALLQKGITGQEFSTIITKNPAEALRIEICKAARG